MFKRPLTIALVALSVPLFGGVAYAATQSVSSEPSPRVVIPTSHTSDDPATHDANDDHGGVATTPTTSDDPSTHDANDDHGGVATTPTTSDDPSTHDANDDHGGRSGSEVGTSGSGSGKSGGSDDPSTHDVGDDHGSR
jgi:hypothetical protein